MASARIAGMRLRGKLLTRAGVWSRILSGCQGVGRLLAGDVRGWLVVQMSVSLVLRGCVWLLDTNVVCVKVTDYFLQANLLSKRCSIYAGAIGRSTLQIAPLLGRQHMLGRRMCSSSLTKFSLCTAWNQALYIDVQAMSPRSLCHG